MLVSVRARRALGRKEVCGGERRVRKREWAKLKRLLAGRKAVEKKESTLFLIGFLVSFSGNEESERETNTRLPRCQKISAFL